MLKFNNVKSQSLLHQRSLFTFMHWRRKWQPTPVFLPGESQGQRGLVGCHLWGCTESDMTEATQQQQQQQQQCPTLSFCMAFVLKSTFFCYEYCYPNFLVISIYMTVFFYLFFFNLYVFCPEVSLLQAAYCRLNIFFNSICHPMPFNQSIQAIGI